MFQTVVTCKRRTTSSCLVLRGRVRHQPRIFTRRHSFLIEKQIIPPPNRRVDQNQHHGGQHRSENIRRRVREQKHNDGQNRETDHDRPIVELVVGHHERLVAEEVEEDPEDDQDG